MKQMSLGTTGFERKTKRTRKRAFLDGMNLVVPWAELVALIAAPSSTKNRDRARDPEMVSGDESQPRTTKKGNQWHFGMKAHIGVDAESGYRGVDKRTPMGTILACLETQPVDGAQTALEHGGAGMSAPKMGHGASNRAEKGPKLPLERAKMSPCETSAHNNRLSGGCADPFQRRRLIMNKHFAWLLVLIMALATSPAAQAGFDEGLAAAQRGDYATALREWRPLAEQGHASAQYNLGVMYENGRGVPQDYAEAVRWYRKAAEQRHADAQNNLGFMYSYGQGVPQDYAEAVRWYRKAAEQGDAFAQYKLGVMYSNGQGVPRDYAEAVRWYRKAAEQGNADAQYNLGVMYKNGRGVPQDYAEAVKWYRKAAEQGNAGAQYNLGMMYYNGQGVPQDYAEAVRWFRKAAEEGLALAQNNLGVMYADGQGVPEDKVLAYALYNLSAANDPSKDNKAPSNRDRLAESLSRSELMAGQALTRELMQPGNFGKALDAWLKKAAARKPPSR